MAKHRPAESRSLRERAGITRQQAADYLGVSLSAIKRAESLNPKRHRPLGPINEIRYGGWLQGLNEKLVASG